jgi:hypothetical protein
VKSKLEKQRLQQQGKSVATNEERKFRPWYPSVKLWIFANVKQASAGMGAFNSAPPGSGSLQTGSGTGLSHAPTSSTSSLSDGALLREKEYIVPADENFVRCPVSKETFDKFWDDDEGGLMYRNAVKVLVTETANKKLFDLGQPSTVEGIRYLIVRKPLIVDGWISSGLAATLSDTMERYQAMGKDGHSIKQLEIAAGYDYGNDIFVMLELVN